MTLLRFVRTSLKQVLIGLLGLGVLTSGSQALPARQSPGFLKTAVLYQIFLRPFTPEGTLDAAAAHLPRLADLGVNIVYLCPIALQDDDPRPEFWSKRQRASGLENPQNPYRIKDFFKVDPEYGTEADLKAFVDKAHALGIKVLLDLVYFHCGPTAVFLQEHPDYVVRHADGKIDTGKWNFPKLNFASHGLREYLWANMEYFIRDFDVDGYRCDVGAAVPVDFWEEGRRRMEAIKPESIMICEGDRVEDQLAAFDLNYDFAWEYALVDLFRGKKTAVDLRSVWQKKRDEFPAGSRFLRILDNHDIAMDSGANRHEIAFGPRGMEAALLINFGMDGVPFIYNGMEIADSGLHSIFANRFHGKELRIDWTQSETPLAKSRQEYLRNLIRLHHTQPALTEGSVQWRENDQPERVVSYSRQTPNQNLLVVVNASNQPRTATVRMDRPFQPRKALVRHGLDYQVQGGELRAAMEPYAYLLLEY